MWEGEGNDTGKGNQAGHKGEGWGGAQRDRASERERQTCRNTYLTITYLTKGFHARAIEKSDLERDIEPAREKDPERARAHTHTHTHTHTHLKIEQRSNTSRMKEAAGASDREGAQESTRTYC